MFLRVLVALRGVTNHDADDNQEDEKIEDENGSDWSKEGGIEHNTMAYETAAENERDKSTIKPTHKENGQKSRDLQFIMSDKVTIEPNWNNHGRNWQH